MFIFSSVLVILVFVIFIAKGAPPQRRTTYQRVGFNESQALDYLRRFGYLSGTEQHQDYLRLGPRPLQDQPKLTKAAIEKFQRSAGIKPSGVLTEETLDLMSKPRCGVIDDEGELNRFRTVSYWSKKDLTYFISKYSYSRSLTSQQIDQEIARAFKVWSDVTDLTFRVAKRHRDERPDIDIKFVTFNHGDGSPFDGRGGTLAHAYYPSVGTVHLDDSEPWTINSHDGVNLFQVAAHEFGHSLGLDHSEVRASLMTPFYLHYQPGFRLHDDDINGIQFLYGRKNKRAEPVSPSKPAYKPPLVNRVCQDLAFDTIFTDHFDVTHVIKGPQYWKLGSTAKPQDIQRKWPGLPARIDAAFNHRILAKTYFFSGAHVWRYESERLDEGYPKLISQRFPGIPDNVDATLVWPQNGQIYFFKGSRYWKFDYTTLPAVAYEYPRQISDWWLGMPDAPDVVFTREGRLFFAKGDQFARIDATTLQVDSAGYRCIRILFECPNARTCTSATEDRAWMSEIKRSRSPKFTESSGQPNHWGCMKNEGCKNVP